MQASVALERVVNGQGLPTYRECMLEETAAQG